MQSRACWKTARGKTRVKNKTLFTRNYHILCWITHNIMPDNGLLQIPPSPSPLPGERDSQGPRFRLPLPLEEGEGWGEGGSSFTEVFYLTPFGGSMLSGVCSNGSAFGISFCSSPSSF